jgi:beta-lactamase regulating signal transducer with metallopeptidase domain
MNPQTWFESLFLLLLRASWQASVLIVLVLLLRWVLRRALPPEWRSWFWLLVLIRLSLPFSFESPWSIFNYSRLKVPAPLSSGMEAREVPASQPALPVTSFEAGTAADLTHAYSQSQSDIAPQAGSPPASSWPWRTILPVVWCAGALVLALKVFLGHRRLALRLRSQIPSSKPALLELLRDCAREVGLRRAPHLIETGVVHSPCIFGLFAPKLLLPLSASSALTPWQMRCVMLHELCHLRRRDIFLNCLTTMLQVLHWFNPLVWLASSRFRADRELACDAMALGHLAQEEAGEYGRTILRLLEGFTVRARVPSMVGLGENIGHLKLRLAMIGRFARRPIHWILLAGSAALILGLVTLTDAQAPRAGQVETAQMPLDLFLFQGCTSARQPCPCAPPESVKSAIEKATPTDLDLRGTPDQLQRKVQELRALTEQYPREVAVHLAYQRIAGGYQRAVLKESGVTPDMLLVEYRSLAQQHPDDALYQYLYANYLLLSRNQAEARRYLLSSLEKDANFAWPHLALARLDANEKKSEPAARHARAFLEKCPCNLDAYGILIHAAPAEQALREIPKVHDLLRQDKGLNLGSYLSLWDTEFQLTPLPEHARVRKEIARDLAAVRRLNQINNPVWWTILKEGYKRAWDQQGMEWVRAERAKHLPRTSSDFRTEFWEWSRDNPHPGFEAPQEKRSAWGRARLGQTAAWIRQQPDDLMAWTVHLDTVASTPGQTEAEVDIACDGLLKAFEQKPENEPAAAPYMRGNNPYILVAYVYLQRRMHLDLVPGLVERVFPGLEAQSGGHPGQAQWTESSHWQALGMLAEAYTGMKQFDHAHKILNRMNSSLARESDAVRTIRAAEINMRKGLLAEAENRKAEALTLYQSALRDRAKTHDPIARQTGDTLLARAAGMWQELRRPEAGWQSFLAELQNTRDEQAKKTAPRWKNVDIPLPDFRLQDAQGKTWQLSMLRGKTCFIHLWAVWSNEQSDQLKPVQDLYDRLKDRSDVLVLTLNADQYTPQIEPFLKEKGYTFPVIPALRYVVSIAPFTGTMKSWIVDQAGTVRKELSGYGWSPNAVSDTIAQIDQVAQQK